MQFGEDKNLHSHNNHDYDHDYDRRYDEEDRNNRRSQVDYRKGWKRRTVYLRKDSENKKKDEWALSL